MRRGIVRKLAMGISTIALLVPATTATAAVQADTPPDAAVETAWDSDAVTQLRAFMAAHGVEAAVQDRLINTLLADGSWDSATEGAEPVSEIDTESGQWIETVHTYADGSIKVSKIANPQSSSGMVQPLGISGCINTVSNAYQRSYRNCRVEESNGFITLGFYVAYSQFAGGEGRIDSMSATCDAMTIGGSWSQTYCGIPVRQGNPAVAEASGTFTTYIPIFSQTGQVKFHVTAYTTQMISNLSLW
jgi:hypothetical protein